MSADKVSPEWQNPQLIEVVIKKKKIALDWTGRISLDIEMLLYSLKLEEFLFWNVATGWQTQVPWKQEDRL